VLGQQSEWAQIDDFTTLASTNSGFAFKYASAEAKVVHVVEHNLGYRPGSIAVFEYSTGTPLIAAHGQGSSMGDPSKGIDPDPTGTRAIDIYLNIPSAIIAYLS